MVYGLSNIASILIDGHLLRASSDRLVFSESIAGDGPMSSNVRVPLGAEGIISKHAGSAHFASLISWTCQSTGAKAVEIPMIP
jgi:hypothetical protein